MINLDKVNQRKSEILAKLQQSVKDNDEKLMAEAMNDWGKFVTEQVTAEAKGIINTTDSQILSARGCRQLTSEENKYYQRVIEASKASDFKQAIANIDVAMPFTIIDSVLEDIETKYELLSLVDIHNTTALTKWIVNKEGSQLAAWGEINSAITKELEGKIGVIDTTLYKLTAFMFVSLDMLDLGPAWVDRYVRAILVDAVGYAAETAIVNGTGKNQPIGMTRDVSDDVTVTAGIYPEKETISITDLSPKTYGDLISQLAKTPTGRPRVVDGLILVVNPSDYYKIIMPATTIQTPSGGYVNNVLPVPTKIIQSVGAPEGKAIIGMAKRYFFGVGTGKNAKLGYDDSYKYLEEQRTYTIKMHATGRPDKWENSEFS